MKAARLFGPGEIRLVELECPVPGVGEVLVRVVAYSPYGTDVGTFLNKGGRYVASYPVGIGADFSGVVAVIGQGVQGFREGDRVSALSLDHCGTCANCEAGRTNLCLDPAIRTAARQECCEEFVLVAARKLAILPDAVSFEEAATLSGPVDALNAFQRMALAQGDELAVVGVGAMGLGAIATAVALGIKSTAIGGRGHRAELARQAGASRVFGISAHNEQVAATVLTEVPHGFPAVMETTASAWGMQQAFAVAAPGGQIALTGGAELPVTSWDIVDRELDVIGIRGGAGQAEVLDLIAQGRLNLRGLISRSYGLEEISDAFALLASGDSKDVGRIIIRVGEPS